MSGGCQEVLPAGKEDDEAKQLFYSTFKGKYSIFMRKVSFLGEFAKLQKATINFVMSVHSPVHPSVCMEHLGSHWTDFHEI